MDPTDESYFGLTYTFTLVEGENHAAGVGEAVDLPEWLSPIPLLKALGAEFGLKVEEVENFHEFFSKRSNVTTNAFAQSALYNMHVLARDGSISQDEWDISRLYMTIKFTKVHDVDVSLGDSDEGSNSSSDEEGQPVESEGVLKRPSTQPPDPLATVRALSKAKEHFGVVEWEKMSTTDKTLALKQFIS
jgi:mRNA (guanine-N7-)-methyltransferase